MKNLLNPALILLLATWSTGHAFTLDAVGYEGGALVSDPVSILVPGYGEVVFETDFGSALVIDPAYGSGGAQPLSVGLSARESVEIEFGSGTGNDGSLVAAAEAGSPPDNVWSAIPEPASAGLGLIGVLMLLFGRWR